MTESAQSPEDAASARAAEQARLRKERREAKIRAGGSARLNKITGLGGGLQRDPIPQPEPKPEAAPSAASSSQQSHDDPAEVDISEHHYEPRTTPRPAPTADSPQQNISEAQLRQMMLGLDNPAGAGAGAGGQVPPGMEGMEQDPMFKMLSQMMAAGGGMPGAGGPGAGANPFAGTGLESLLGGLGGGGGFPGMPPSPQQQQQQQQAAAAAKTANLWRILHAVFAVGLGLYVALTTTLVGTQVERDTDGYYDTKNLEGLAVESNAIEQTRAYFFYLFSTVEALLLAARYLTEKEPPPPSGMLWTVSGFVPSLQPYLRHGLRYFQIFSTVRNDALVCVFVLGVSCWLRS